MGRELLPMAQQQKGEHVMAKNKIKMKKEAVLHEARKGSKKAKKASDANNRAMRRLFSRLEKSYQKLGLSDTQIEKIWKSAIMIGCDTINEGLYKDHPERVFVDRDAEFDKIATILRSTDVTETAGSKIIIDVVNLAGRAVATSRSQ